MRYARIILGLGVFVLCVVVGAFIPIGGGSAAFIGGVIGLILCGVVLSQKRFWSNSSGADDGSGEVNQKALEQKTLSIQETHIIDQMSAEYRNRRG